MRSKNIYDSAPIKAAVAAYQAGDMQACVAHYHDAIRRYPELGQGIRATLDAMRRLHQPGMVDAKDWAPPGQALSQSDSPIASTLRSMGIEHIYVVNLDRRPDRMARVLREMNAHGLKVSRVPAVDARSSLQAKSLMEAFGNRDPSAHLSSAPHVSFEHVEQWKKRLTSGVFGYLLSQAAVLEDAARNGYKRVLVFDDDVFFTSDAHDRLREASRHLPADWKVLLLGASEYADGTSQEFVDARVAGCADLYHPIAGKTCGSFAVAYDQSIYDEILTAIADAEAPYDNFALGSTYVRHRKHCFVIDPAVCVPDVSESNIREGSRAQQSHSQRMRWEFARYGAFTAPVHIALLVDDPASLKYLELLDRELPGNTVLDIYYRSPQGICAIAPGQRATLSGEGMLQIAAADGVALRQLAKELCVPQAAIVMLWPFHRAVEGYTAQAVLARALEGANSGGRMEGVVDGVVYCLDDAMAPVRGRYYEHASRKLKVVVGVTTYNRLDYLREFVESWDKTRNRNYEWTLIVSDDGSSDGTLEYLDALRIEGVSIHVVKHQRVGVHESTNSIIDRCILMDFDYGFKCDDDVIFKSIGWDDAYIDAMGEYPYLCNYNTSWRPAKPIATSAKCVAYANAYYSQGALWTFTKAVIAKLGWFDVKTFGFKGYGHIDYSVRASRAGFNEMANLFDLKDSAAYLTLQAQDYKPALSETSMKQDFGLVVDEALKDRMRNLILEGRRDVVYVPRASIYEFPQSTKQPRLHLLIENNHLGGAEYVHYCHALALRQQCRELVVWSVGQGHYFDRLVADGFTVRYVPHLHDMSSVNWKAFVDEVEDGDFIYNANAYLERNIAELAKRRFVYHHAILHSDMRWIVDHHRKYRFFTHKLIAIHRHIRDALLAAGVSPDKIEIVQNALEPDFPFGRDVEVGARVRESLDIPADALVVGFVGRIAKDKNALDLLRIADSVTRRRSDVHFVIAGGAQDTEEGREYGAEFQRLLSAIRHRERVHHVGETLGSKLTDLLNALDVAVNVSPSEGLPIALLEQLAKGIHCVYPGFPAIADLLAQVPSTAVGIVQRMERKGLEYTGAERQAFVDALVRLQREKLVSESGRIEAYATANFGFARLESDLHCAFLGRRA